MMENKKVAWIGTGVMGSQQAGHLAKNGYDVSAYTHKYEKLLELEKEFGHPSLPQHRRGGEGRGLHLCDGRLPKRRRGGVLRGGAASSSPPNPGALAIDMTTSSPSLAQRAV